MAAFYRQFGWLEAATSVPEHVVFQCANGVVLGLFSASVYEPQLGDVASGFRGFTLIWDVAFKHGSDFDHRGGFVYP